MGVNNNLYKMYAIKTKMANIELLLNIIKNALKRHN